MKKRLLVMLAMATMLMGTCAMAEETEAVEEPATAEEAVERNYAPEAGTGWLVAKINGEDVELEFESATKGMTGKTYSFASEEYEINLMLNKSLKVGEEMEENAITQIEVLSHVESSYGYYFTKKSPGAAVVSTVTLAETENEDMMQGEFTVTVPSGDRYVGDFRPGILPELVFTEGEFCFCE